MAFGLRGTCQTLRQSLAHLPRTVTAHVPKLGRVATCDAASRVLFDADDGDGDEDDDAAADDDDVDDGDDDDGDEDNDDDDGENNDDGDDVDYDDYDDDDGCETGRV